MNSTIIPDIFNYCDRWCERCLFTDQCAIFEMEDDFSEVESDDFFYLLEHILDDTIAMVEAVIQTEVPDLWGDWQKRIDTLEGAQAPLPELEEELIRLSRQYFMSGRKWLQAHDPLLKAQRTAWYEQSEIGVDQQGTTDQLEDALVVIQWYQPSISAKVQRAIRGKSRPWLPEQDPYQNDANGSAKIALLAIDRSLSSWELIRNLIPEATDDMLDLLVQLSQLRSGMQRLFPDTERFIRPGFDKLGNARSDS